MLNALASVQRVQLYRPTPPLRPFWVDESPQQVIRAANGTGKTLSACAKLARRALARPGSRHRLVGPTRAQVRETSAYYLWELLRDYLDPRSSWSPGTGWNRNGVILLLNGSTIEVRSYEDPVQSHEGQHHLDTILLDEVPPRAHFWANKGRARMVIITFTVQTKAPPDWLRDEIEGPPEARGPSPSGTEGDVRTEHRTGWVQYVVPMLRENVPFYDDVQFAAKVKKYQGTEEEDRRIWASWEAASEVRSFDGWGSRLVLSRAQILDRLRDTDGRYRWDRARYGIDYGNGKKQAQYITIQKGSRFYVVHEYAGKAGTGMSQHAAGMVKGTTLWFGDNRRGGLVGGQGLRTYDKVVGDINSAGPAHDGDSLNHVFEQYLVAASGVDPLPFNVRAPASKLEGALQAREIAVNHCMLERRFYVCDECPQLMRAYALYEGGPKDPWKDPIDAVGYSIQDLVLMRERDLVQATVRR
jgi:hypothetical protein